MKILVVAYKFGTEREIGEHLGTYHYFIETLRRMVLLGHEIYVVAPWLSFTKKGSVDVGGVKVLRYYPPLFNRPKLLILNQILCSWYIMATSRKVLELDHQEQLDVICVWQARETGYAVAKVADKLRAPFIFRQITAWQWHFERMTLDRKPQEKFAKTIYEKAKRVIFVSQAAAAAEKALGIPAEKIRTMGVAIETDVFKPTGITKGGKTILFIGRINFAEKGIGYLLEAMPEIIKAVPGVNLVIVGGGGEEQRMRQLIAKLGISQHVRLKGRQPFERLPEYLNAANVMVVPSVWVEHFGQVTVEAMSAGVPVVTTDRGGSPEINLHEETGLVVRAANSGRLARALIRVLKDEQLQKRFGEAGRRRVLQNYTYEVLINKFLDIIRELKHGPR